MIYILAYNRIEGVAYVKDVLHLHAVANRDKVQIIFGQDGFRGRALRVGDTLYETSRWRNIHDPRPILGVLQFYVDSLPPGSVRWFNARGVDIANLPPDLHNHDELEEWLAR